MSASNSILRHLRLVRLFWSTSIAAEMEYRLNFAISSLSSVLGVGGTLFTLRLFYATGNDLGGWPWSKALLVTGLFTVFEGLMLSFLSPNLGRIVRHVQTGTLDFVLLKPVDSQFWLSTRNFSPWGLPDAAVGVGIILVAGYILHLGPLDYLRATPVLASAILVLYSIWFLVSATSVWFVKIYNVTEALRSFLEAGKFPVSAYPPAFRFFFTFILPVVFLTTVPAQAMLGEATLGWSLASLFVSAALFAVARGFWRFALRYYTSASS